MAPVAGSTSRILAFGSSQTQTLPVRARDVYSCPDDDIACCKFTGCRVDFEREGIEFLVFVVYRIIKVASGPGDAAYFNGSAGIGAQDLRNSIDFQLGMGV